MAVGICNGAGGRGSGRLSTLQRCFFFFLFLVVSPLVLAAVARADEEGGDGRRDDHGREGDSRLHAPNAVERAMGVFCPGGAWEAIRSWANLAFLNRRPPDSGFSTGRPSTGNVVEEAAMRSLEAGKATAEGAAKTAAKVTEAAVKKTKEKVKRTVSSKSGGGGAEL